jgi:hypothetical protein
MHQKISPNVSHTDKQGCGQCKGQCELAQPRGLIRVESVTLSSRIADREHEENREQSTN